jgi:undecaprenyl-diphosphatase
MNEIINIDQSILYLFNGSHSLYVDTLMTVFTNAFTWVPLYLVLIFVIIKNNETMPQILLAIGGAVLCVLITDLIADFIVKPYVERWRPTQDPFIKYTVDVVNGIRETKYGFFSAHAANTFSIAIYFCWLIRSRMLSLALIIWSFTNCWTRMYLGVHFPGDILVGLTWGFIVGTFAYYVYYRLTRKMTSQRHFISTKYTSTGYERSHCDIPITVLVFTLIYALIKACI